MILDTSVCANSGTLQAIYIIKSIIKIICILGPIIVIITSMVSLFKCVTNNDDVKESVKKFITKFIVCAFIFFIPTIITTIIGVINNGKESKNFLSCYNDATKEKIEYYKEKEEKEAAEKIAERKKQQEENEKKIAEQEEEREKAAQEAIERNQDTISTGGGIPSDNYRSRLDSMATPSISTLESVASSIGITNEYLIIVIGTTQNEGYYEDPYLYYGWASAMLNHNYTIEAMQGWDGRSGEDNYYSWTHINNGYNNASNDVLKSVYLAITNRNTKINECNGMYSETPSTYNLLYESQVYNCSIYELK